MDNAISSTLGAKVVTIQSEISRVAKIVDSIENKLIFSEPTCETCCPDSPNKLLSQLDNISSIARRLEKIDSILEAL